MDVNGGGRNVAFGIAIRARRKREFAGASLVR
jgi:hypothetical protein